MLIIKYTKVKIKLKRVFFNTYSHTTAIVLTYVSLDNFIRITESIKNVTDFKWANPDPLNQKFRDQVLEICTVKLP